MLNDNNGQFLHVPLGVGEWPLDYERCWANSSHN